MYLRKLFCHLHHSLVVFFLVHPLTFTHQYGFLLNQDQRHAPLPGNMHARFRTFRTH